MTAGAPGVELRALTTQDVPALVRMEDELFGAGAWSAQSLLEEVVGPGRWYVGAQDAAGDLDGEDVQVMTIGTDLAHQGRGVGRLLLTALLARGRELGARAALLEVRVDNEPALRLYESAGFERLGLRRGSYQPENADAWTMRLDLRRDDGEAP